MDLPSTPSFARVSASSAARTFNMFDFRWKPMMSKRKPSTLYAFAHSTIESTMSFSIIACSVAVSAQQLSPSTTPSPLRRW
jgi:hypothetical protein